MSTEFLETGLHNFRQVAALILLGNADGLFDLSFFQAAGNGGSEFARLFAGLAEGDITINHDADRPSGHDGEQNDDALGRSTHVGPHRTQVKVDLAAALQEHHRKKIELNEKHRITTLLNPV